MSTEEESRRLDELLAAGHISEEEATRQKSRLLEEKRRGIAEQRGHASATGEQESAEGTSGGTKPMETKASFPSSEPPLVLETIHDMQVVSEHSDDLESIRKNAAGASAQSGGSASRWGVAFVAFLALAGAVFVLFGDEKEEAAPPASAAETPRSTPAVKSAADAPIPREEVVESVRGIQAVKGDSATTVDSVSPDGLPAECLGKWVVDVLAMRQLPEYARRHEMEFVKDAARFSAMRFDIDLENVTQTLGKAPQRHRYSIQEQSAGTVVLALTDSGGAETSVTLTFGEGRLTMQRGASGRKMLLMREGAPSGATPSPEEVPGETETAVEEASGERAQEEVPVPAQAPTDESAYKDATHVVFNTSSDPKEPWLNMRRGPSSRTIVLGQLPDGTPLKFLAASRGRWVKVEVLSGDAAGKIGFVNTSWLQKL